MPRTIFLNAPFERGESLTPRGRKTTLSMLTRMPATSPIPKQIVGRTFFVAIIILGVVALAQLGAVAWVFIVKFHSTPQSEMSVAVREQEPSATPPGPGKLKLTETFAPPETSPPASLPKPTPIAQSALAQKLSPVQGRQIELINEAKALRDRGDMSTALTRLREAMALSPDNPAIISEMAVTYEKMGMKEKALEQWRRIEDMGEAAGIYFSAADAKLKNVDTQPRPNPDGSSPKDAEGFQPGSVLALVDISKVDSTEDAEKKFTLKIPLKRRPDAKIDSPNDVVIHVFFYDLLEDGSVVQTDANMTYRWTTLPVNWNDSDVEVLEVDYAASTPNPKQKHPEIRKYFGYIVRVYYKNELQDMRAEPVKLLKQYPPPLTLTSEDAK